MDISAFLKQPRAMKPGAAYPYLEGFGSALATAGHRGSTISGYLDSAIHFGGWVEVLGIDVANIDDQTVKEFGAHSCDCPGRRRENRLSRYYVARVERFIDHLREQCVIKAAPDVESCATPQSLIAFREWLLRHRGLAIRTVDRYELLVTRMLPALGVSAATYDAASIRKVVLDTIRGFRPAHAKTFVVALRAYLRFLTASGECQPGLDNVLPPVAEWRLSSLPRYLGAKEAQRLIDSCSERGPQGPRDRAIILLLVRLGLRGGDIAAMRPGDLDWQEATLLVRGKGRRDVRLPLPQDAGDAVLHYMEHARPLAAIDRVFLCVKAPFRPIQSGIAVSGIVRAALRRAGIENPPSHGANLLRHTAATTMLRGGFAADCSGISPHASLQALMNPASLFRVGVSAFLTRRSIRPFFDWHGLSV